MLSVGAKDLMERDASLVVLLLSSSYSLRLCVTFLLPSRMLLRTSTFFRTVSGAIGSPTPTIRRFEIHSVYLSLSGACHGTFVRDSARFIAYRCSSC